MLLRIIEPSQDHVKHFCASTQYPLHRRLKPVPMPELTDRQASVLAYIRSYTAEHTRPPTRAEIVTAFGFASPNAAQSHLRALARRGAIELIGGTSRGIRLLEPIANADQLPLIGRVAAGSPILAIGNVEAYHQIAPTLFSPRADYLLRVQGHSMIDAGIHEHDLLAIHATPQAQDGRIVVARIDDEVTVKRLRRKNGTILLEPANPAFSPIAVDAARHGFAIEGIVCGIIRRQGF